MINEIGLKERREEQEEKYVYVEHTTAQNTFFFSPLAKSIVGEDDVACDFATYLIKGGLCGRSMNEDGKNFRKTLGYCEGKAWTWRKFMGNCHKLTCTIRPTTNTIATQLTISAWFWITNSWLRIGGFFLSFLLPNGLARNADDIIIFSLFFTQLQVTQLTKCKN